MFENQLQLLQQKIDVLTAERDEALLKVNSLELKLQQTANAIPELKVREDNLSVKNELESQLKAKKKELDKLKKSSKQTLQAPASKLSRRSVAGARI